MEQYAHALADFVRVHQVWAAPIVFLLAFGESLAFISLLVPAWGALVAIGALIGVSGISFYPVWIAGAIGAALGDWVSYWFGFRYKEQVAQMWPLSRYPEILPRGEAFVRSWGVPSIFIGRFFGPLRASVPLAAGIFEMPYWSFQAANFISALVWAAALLLFGDVMAKIMEWILRLV
ncbi:MULTISPECIES: DedA family protein [unclassified Bradyrhizobium]|uniref:DedA family protein n=1 Tax=unclassified Bradyrhizobium TaxID=2631580 RepID=UPI00047F8A9D|nr:MULTISPECIES: DedA family protein [unclassified Bradyrhizobium]MCP3466358.1 DedA family protein [Bradyrhizobium sp. CCGUVB23]